jgi:DinB family protein
MLPAHPSGVKSPARLWQHEKMTESGLPCLDLLEATPGILRGLLSGVSDDDAHWKPSPDRFSIAEVLAHLSHSEGHCYRLRLDRFLAEELPELEPDDAQMWLDLYRNADPEDAFDHFEEQRETNVEFLRALPAGAGERIARHKEIGEITLSNMLYEWALHDLGHVRQVAELVRARKYLAGAGPLGESYRLKP